MAVDISAETATEKVTLPTALSGNSIVKHTKKFGFMTRIYLPMLAKGLMVSMREFLRKPVTIQYPEQTPKISERFRGEHRLTKDAEGHMKCVACYMCATACPALCITIEAQAAPPEWEGRDKIPRVFEIDMLKCIYCGYCVEACPKEAIEMTNKWPRVYDNRQDFIYGMDKLLNN